MINLGFNPLDHNLVKELSSLNSNEFNESSLILAHIKAENKYATKNKIDKYHSYLFRDYHTILGYKNRYKKYNNDIDTIFPYGTSVLGVVAIMIYHNNPSLARLEATLICPHPQSLLICEAIITLFSQKSLDSVTKLLSVDASLLNTCKMIQTNVSFIPDWCRHYLLAVIYGFMKWPFDSKHIPILKFIYSMTLNHFHSSDEESHSLH